MIGQLIAHDGFYDIVGEIGGEVIGSNFLDERNPISGVGPITIDPQVQNDGVGRALMAAVMERSQQRGFAGIRLVQAAYHNRSLSLYLKLGFNAREQLVCVRGNAIGKAVPGCTVRAAMPEDAAECNALCFRVHGHARGSELAEAIDAGTARVVESRGRLTGYATAMAFSGHAVGESNCDLQALFGAAQAFGGAGILVPTRNSDLVRWCLEHGLRITQTLTLMTIGLYNQPEGAWLPSILY